MRGRGSMDVQHYNAPADDFLEQIIGLPNFTSTDSDLSTVDVGLVGATTQAPIKSFVMPTATKPIYFSIVLDTFPVTLMFQILSSA